MWNQLRKMAQNSIDLFIEKNRYFELSEPIEAGDKFSRVEFGVKKGQEIQTYSMGSGVYGIWVSGDTDYWTNRLAEDYSLDKKDARSIKIRAADGDRMIEDYQYATDPDTGIKADAAILLTTRQTLKYGVDWVFEDDVFEDEKSMYQELPKEHPLKIKLQEIHTQIIPMQDDDPLWDDLLRKEQEIQKQIMEEEKKINRMF